SAFGHLLTLKDPEDYDPKFAKWDLESLPIFFENWGKKPGAGKEERLALIGRLLKDAQCVIHAGDPDDEGQYLIDEILDWFAYKGPVLRLSTGDTTEGALRRALTEMKDNADFRGAGLSAHARAVADIMTGYNFSRYFTLKNPHIKMLTVGRVQTPALGLVVARDQAIEGHTKLTYQVIRVPVKVEGKTVTAVYEPAKDDPALEDGRITDREYAEDLADSLSDRDLDEIRIAEKDITDQPPLPFNLVKLQTYASGKFGYDPSKVLEITQDLRDRHNAITYNRSDCQYLSEEQFAESPQTVRTVLENLSGDPAGKIFERLPLDTKLHSKAFNDKNITAHTAIIPQRRRFDVSKLTEEERNIYLAIVKYYMAQFLPPAKKVRTSLEAPAEGGLLKASSTKIISPGYMQLIKPEKDDEEDRESELSAIPEGEYAGRTGKAEAEEKETKAPPRYTKASLNEDMTRIAKYVTDPRAKALLLAKDKDKKGENGSIGTSATRSGIIDTLEERGYIETRGKQIQSTQLGRELCRILPDQLKKPDMTGLWWAVQEEIRDGEVPWTALTDSVLDMIRSVIKTEYPKVDAYHVPESMRRGRLLLGTCPRCGKDVIKGKNGFGCSGFKDGCRFIIWKSAKTGMMSRTEVTADMVHTWLASGWEDEMRPDDSGVPVPTGRKRSKGAVLCKKLWSEAKKISYSGRVYLTDEGAGSERGAGFGIESIEHEPPKSLGKCPRCGKDVIEGRDGYGCSGYRDGCRFIIWKKAKSGMMSKAVITKTMVKTLLSSPWEDEIRTGRDGQQAPTGKKRTQKTVHIKKLYSQSRDKTYTGDVYLTDEGPSSQYGAGFGLERVTDDGPEVLGRCPRCGKDVVETANGYGCTGFSDGCRFMIWKKQKQKMLSKIEFTKTDAKRFLAGKPTRKNHLIDKKGAEFKADLIMEETPDNPYGPVFRAVEGTIEVKDDDPSAIKIETVKADDAKE
ncbi:MAG: hypothetical protein II166_03120, partial [Firmicutes bacterium]|nr:hypothetical protein [Bacillota bacterium]